MVDKPQVFSKDGDEYNDFIWIGLKKDEKGEWHWVDGTFTKWSIGEANNVANAEGCAQMYTAAISHHKTGAGSTYWNDVRCNRRMRYFIRKVMVIWEKT
ncbi:hypothetical protein ANCDUO_23446, partial [Ancylostoma duodenale]